MIALIFFSFILLFGVTTSYEDIQEGKIRNKYVLLAFIFTALINSLMFFGFIEDHSFDKGYYLALLINVIIAFLVGFAFWICDIWTPGDAKLFTAYAVLVPLTTYQLGYASYFPSYTLLSNTFTPLFFLILLSVPFSIKNADKKLIKNLFNPKILADRIIFLFGFLWFFNALFSFLGMQLTFLMYLLLFIAIPYIFNRIKFISLIRASIILSILRLIFDFNAVFTIRFLIFFISLVFVFVIVMLLIGLGGFFKTTTVVNIENLKAGMVLAEEIRSGDEIISSGNRKLAEDEIELLSKLYREKRLESDLIRIQQTLPFAPFLFFGVLLTYFCQGDLIVFLKILFKI